MTAGATKPPTHEESVVCTVTGDVMEFSQTYLITLAYKLPPNIDNYEKWDMIFRGLTANGNTKTGYNFEIIIDFVIGN